MDRLGAPSEVLIVADCQEIGAAQVSLAASRRPSDHEPGSADIDASGYDFVETLAKDRRRRTEAAQAEKMSELGALLLPLSLALARLTARRDILAAIP